MAGRKPLRDKAMTGAERQARFRARYRRPGDHRSRQDRARKWQPFRDGAATQVLADRARRPSGQKWTHNNRRSIVGSFVEGDP